jgi:SAM-dependent methyltransferase/anti-anti-sigma regulatory factor
MEFTGERVVPGKVEPDLYNEHLSRYYFAQPLVKGRLALDLGCGTGFGAAILARSARKVLGLDISKESVAFARENYVAPNLEFFVSDSNRLAVCSGSIDTVVCMEVIEHLPDQEALMEEVCRVLRPEGILVISTPNRIYYTEERGEVNPFHVKEFDFREFSTFLKNYFDWVDIVFQNHVASIFIGDTGSYKGARFQVEYPVTDPERTANYFVGVCSKAAALHPTCKPLVYLPSAANVLRERETYIRTLQARERELAERVLQQQREHDVQSQWCQALNQELQEFQKQYRALEQEFRERTGWAERLSAEVSEKDQRIISLQTELDERTAWALRLDEERQGLEQELRERTVCVERLSAEISQRDEHLASLQAELDERSARALRLGLEHWALEQELRERTVWAGRLSAEVAQRDERIASLQAEFNERTAWALRLNEEHRALGQRIGSLQAEFNERTAWTLQLNEELKLSVEKLNSIRRSKLFQLSNTLGLVPKV